MESRLLSGDDGDDDGGTLSPTLASMMQNPRSCDGDGDRFGTLRFRCEYVKERRELLVTLIDACDLPPMDPNGRADPYIVVTVRPPSRGGEPRQYKTAIRHNCLNPTFNETAKLKLLPDEIQGGSAVDVEWFQVHTNKNGFKSATKQYYGTMESTEPLILVETTLVSS